MRVNLGIDLVVEIEHGLPLGIAIGLGDTRIFMDARNLHGEFKLRLAHFRGTDHRRGRRRLGSGCQWNMAFASQLSRCRIETDPASTGNIGFGPGLQISEIMLGAGGSVEGFLVWLELD